MYAIVQDVTSTSDQPKSVEVICLLNLKGCLVKVFGWWPEGSISPVYKELDVSFHHNSASKGVRSYDKNCLMRPSWLIVLTTIRSKMRFVLESLVSRDIKPSPATVGGLLRFNRKMSPLMSCGKIQRKSIKSVKVSEKMALLSMLHYVQKKNVT